MREEELKDNAMVSVTKIILRYNEEMLKVFMFFFMSANMTVVIVLLHVIKYVPSLR